MKTASVTSTGPIGANGGRDVPVAEAVKRAAQPLCMLLDLTPGAHDPLLPGAPCDLLAAGEATQTNIVRPGNYTTVKNSQHLVAYPTTETTAAAGKESVADPTTETTAAAGKESVADPTTETTAAAGKESVATAAAGKASVARPSMELGADTRQACPGIASQTAAARVTGGMIVKAGWQWPRDYVDTELNAELDILQELPKEKMLEFSKLCNMQIKNKFHIMHCKLAPTLAQAEEHVKRVQTLREKFNQDCKRLEITEQEWQTYRLLENKKRKLEELFGAMEGGKKKSRSEESKAKPGL